MDRHQYEFYHENKEHTSSDFPYNTYICSIPLDFKSVKTHWHDEIEIIVIKKGMGKVFVDLTEYHVKSGDSVFISSGQLHSIEQKDGEIMEYENIIFKPSLLKSSGQDICSDRFLTPLFCGQLDIVPVINENCACFALFSEYIKSIDSLCSKKLYGYQLAVKGYLFQIMYLMIYQISSAKKSEPKKKSLEKVKMILGYIENHYHENISIGDMANYCFYSKSYFMKFFKETMGVGFTAYLNDYRLDTAAKMLLSTTENIIDIAAKTGFDNLSYFNRSFKKKFGITPGKYRK